MEDMRNGTCALCGHTKVIEFRPKSRGYKSAYNSVVAVVVDPGPFSFYKEGGQLLAYACQKCGFAQTFVEGRRWDRVRHVRRKTSARSF